MKCIIFVIVFLSFFIVSCGGEEPNLPDDESVVDETTDESPDEDVVETTDEAEDTVSTDEDTTETEVDEDVDDQEIVYKELESLDECEDSPCKNLCFLQWDEESGKEVKLYKLEENQEISTRYSRVFFEVETSHNLCYVNFVDDGDILISFEGKILAEALPFKGIYQNSDNRTFYFFFSDTESDFENKKILNYKQYTSCMTADNQDWCEIKEKKKYTLEGLEGEYFIDEEFNVVPLP